jgi:hypothetical protein
MRQLVGLELKPLLLARLVDRQNPQNAAIGGGLPGG